MHDRTITPSTGVKPAMAPTETFGDNAGEVLVDANGVTLCAEAFGRPDDPAMLLVQGACASRSAGRSTSAHSVRPLRHGR